MNATPGQSIGESGMTLLELSISMILVVALSAVVLPLLSNIDETRASKASVDCQEIATALIRYMQDTRLPPTGTGGASVHARLVSDRGDLPAFASSASSASLDAVLLNNAFGEPRWRGPYMEVIPPDPWGRRYVVLASSFHNRDPVWVLSAGTDGRISTVSGAKAPSDDDIGVQVP